MSNTIVDMPKVCQMLDSGWCVTLARNQVFGTYSAIAKKMIEGVPKKVSTDDFTPEQSLTRLAYKVHGEILRSEP